MVIVQSNRRSVSTLIAAVAAAVCLSGCATLVGGGHGQRVHIDSEPQGAQVQVDGQPRGATPTDVELSRRRSTRCNSTWKGTHPMSPS